MCTIVDQLSAIVPIAVYNCSIVSQLSAIVAIVAKARNPTRRDERNICTIVALLITDQLSAIVAETEMPGVLCVSLSRTGSHKSHRTDKTDQHVGNTDPCKYNEKYKYKKREIQKED